MDSPLFHRAAIVAFAFKVTPDEAMRCDRRTWALRCAAADLLITEKLIVKGG